MLLLSDSFSRRYTPPTCTLEINAQTSVLSRWSRQPVLKQLQFHLSFDNLLHSNDQPIQVSGDRIQLDALCEAVESYVQKRLNQFPTSWQTLLPEPPAVTDQPKPPAVTDDQLRLFEPATSRNRAAQPVRALATLPEPSDTQGIYLQQKGLSHDLFLGSLTTEASGSVINLSTTQLFDLASALEEYAAESVALPNPGQRPWVAPLQGTPIWARTAAIAAVAVGITTATLQLTNNSNPISQKPSEQPSTLPPPTVPPPPPPASSTPSPSNLSTVPLPATLPNPSDLPDIEPPPDRSTSSSKGAASKSQQSKTAKKATIPSAPISADNQIIAVQPRSYPTASQMTAARKAAAKLKSSGTISNETFGIASAPTTQSKPLNETALDTIPQIAEVRSYFQKTWLPPQGLKQSLQYTLILNPDGSIERALPRGQASDTYLDRTPIPLANEPFFTPIKGKSHPKVRLVLDPDGSVKTFLESSN